MGEERGVSRALVARATGLPQAAGARRQWDGRSGVCRDVGPHPGSEYGPQSSFQAKTQSVTAHRTRPYWTTDELGRVSAFPLQAIAWEQEAARVTFTLDPVLLADTAHRVLPRVTGEVVWVHGQEQTELSFVQEQALGRRIQRWQRRVRWALYTSPMALPTLRRLWHQMEPQHLSLHEVVQHPVGIMPAQTEQRAQSRQAILSLQDLATRLERLEAPSGLPRRASQEGRGLRHARFSLWRAWLTTYEALQLPPHIHEAMREALTDTRQTPPLDPALQAASRVWARAQRELDQAKAQMMQANLRFVIYVAQRYGNRGVPLLDLIQEGNLGLMRAVEKFEPRRGLKLITYAHWWIRQAISRALSEQYRTIRLPSHVIERENKLYAATRRLWTSHGRAPSAQELSAALGWTPQEVEALLIAVQPIAQLQQPVTDGGDALQDFVEDTQAPQPDELVAEEQVRRGVRECLGHLTEREAMIMRLRYGLDAHEPHSLRDIGALYGISHERVRQLEQGAFAKLRQLQQSAVLAELVQ